jgi:hypothetical protein
MSGERRILGLPVIEDPNIPECGGDYLVNMDTIIRTAKAAALREAADEFMNGAHQFHVTGRGYVPTSPRDWVIWLRQRADELEAKP